VSQKLGAESPTAQRPLVCPVCRKNDLVGFTEPPTLERWRLSRRLHEAKWRFHTSGTNNIRKLVYHETSLALITTPSSLAPFFKRGTKRGRNPLKT
jgi:hypothetical protein